MTVTDLGHDLVAVTFETHAMTVAVLDALIADLGLPSRDHAVAYAIARTYQREGQAQAAPPPAPKGRRDTMAEPVGNTRSDEARPARSTGNVCLFPARRA